MKRFFKGVGKASLYFLTYLGMQLLVSFGIVKVVDVYAQMTCKREDGTLHLLKYIDKYNSIMSQGLYWAMILSGLLTILVFFIVAKIRKKKFKKSASLNKLNPATIAPIVLGGIAFNFLISFVMNIIPFPESWIDSYATESSQLLGTTGIPMWISVVIMAPIVEELTFRGFMYTRLKQGMNKWIAVILTSLIFGFVHGTIIWAIYTFVFSLCLIFILERTKSLFGAVLFHMSFNLVGAVMSTWPDMFEKMNALVILGASALIYAGATVWFLKISKAIEE